MLLGWPSASEIGVLGPAEVLSFPNPNEPELNAREELVLQNNGQALGFEHRFRCLSSLGSHASFHSL